jgi:hypothetical protein
VVSPKRMDHTGNYLASDNDLVVWPEGADGQATDHSNIRNTPVVQDKSTSTASRAKLDKLHQVGGCGVTCRRRIICTKCTRDSNALIMRVAASWNIPLAT